MGGYPKALLKKNGESFLKHFINAAKKLEPIEILVVCGFYSNKIEAEVGFLKQNIQSSIALVKNTNPELGQSSSVRLGLESLTSNYDVLLIALCDQPSIASAEIEALLEQFNQRDPNQEIILPMVNGQRGNPVLFSRGVIEKILAIPEMVCRPFMDQHPELIKVFDTNNQAYLMDVDTKADIQKLGIDPI